jgi:uncharacterized protein YfaS (alpha-2-macroglobulin family)
LPPAPKRVGDSLAKGKAVPQLGLSIYPAGALIEVDIVVATSMPRSYVAVEDPLPGGLVAVDPTLGEEYDEENPGPARDARYARELYTRRELRDDRVVFFIDHLPAGIHHLRYWARASAPGTYIAPPARAFEMYVPETHGRSAAEWVRVAQ